MTTDTTLNAWKRWLTYSISKAANSPVADLPIRLRDSEETKEYPGIYIEEGGVNRVESGGVKDGNCWQIEVQTKLVTVPGEDDQAAISRSVHEMLRVAVSIHVNSCQAEDWLDGQIGITCQQVLTSSPVTTDEGGHRVTTWRNELVVCVV